MARKAPTTDIDEAKARVGSPKKVAVGVPAVMHALEIAYDQMGVTRSVQTLMRVNQKDGFDCPGCAWPEADHRHIAEFCENGAKAVAEEATVRRVGPEFFAEHSLADLAGHDDWWLGQQGRLTHPMILDEGATHYRPISWDEALGEIADALRAVEPDEAVFYTSGRTSNEAAFLYQLLVRGLGTNNLPESVYVKNQTQFVRWPTPPTPSFASAPGDAIDRIKPTGRPLEFRTQGLGHPEDVTLEPLYRIHDQRYAVYWDLRSEAEIGAPKSAP